MPLAVPSKVGFQPTVPVAKPLIANDLQSIMPLQSGDTLSHDNLACINNLQFPSGAIKPTPTVQCFEDIALAPGSGTAFSNDSRQLPETFFSRSPEDNNVTTFLFIPAIFQSNHGQNNVVLSQSNLKWVLKQCAVQCAVQRSPPTVKLKLPQCHDALPFPTLKFKLLGCNVALARPMVKLKCRQHRPPVPWC